MAPLGYLWAFPGPPGASRMPLGSKTNQSNKPRNLKELTEQWRKCDRVKVTATGQARKMAKLTPETHSNGSDLG